MFGARRQLFRLLGIPISLDISWLFILILLTNTLMYFYMEKVPDLAPLTYFVLGLVSALVFFACIVLHEMGHALVARAVGIPIRGITLFLFGGVAELEDEPKSARSEFLMAIAGPVVSAVLGAAFLVLGAAATALQWPLALVVMLYHLGIINLSVLVFNLVPAFPLDGGRVLRSALWAAFGSLRRATYWAALCGRGFAWLLIGLGLLCILNRLYIPGIWLGLIGLFLDSAARGSYQAVLIRQTLHGEPVRRFMTREPIVVPAWLDLHRWIEDYVYRYHRKSFPVGAEGRVEGYITTEMLARFPRAEWEKHTVEEVMERDIGPVTISPDADALEALGRMQRTGSSRLLVMEGNRLVGIISLKDLLRFLHLKLELEGEEAGKSHPADAEDEAEQDEPVARV
jgi:Zn-dependent protease